jgi:hypothetical protein
MISRKLIRSCNLMALDSFFGKAWFKRVWVVQEFVSAREIELFADLDCSDERDRVYAALGLTGDDLAIYPDYILSLIEIVLELSRKTFLTGELAVLHHTEPEERNTQPSSIPRIRDDFPLVHAESLGGDIIPRHTAGCLRDSFASLFGSSSICIPGMSVDEIVYTDFFINVLDDLTTGVGSPFKPQLSDAYECAKNAYAAQTTGNFYGSITF